MRNMPETHLAVCPYFLCRQELRLSLAEERPRSPFIQGFAQLGICTVWTYGLPLHGPGERWQKKTWYDVPTNRNCTGALDVSDEASQKFTVVMQTSTTAGLLFPGVVMRSGAGVVICCQSGSHVDNCRRRVAKTLDNNQSRSNRALSPLVCVSSSLCILPLHEEFPLPLPRSSL